MIRTLSLTVLGIIADLTLQALGLHARLLLYRRTAELHVHVHIAMSSSDIIWGWGRHPEKGRFVGVCILRRTAKIFGPRLL